jgi:hypothetical protein
LAELSTITAKAFFWFVDIGGIVDITVLGDKSTNINKPKES